MVTGVLVLFVLVYVGMALGRLPWLALDRAGVALLGGVSIAVLCGMSPVEAWAAVDMSTLYLLFALMLISAQLRLAGFYTEVTRRLAAAQVSPAALLALVVGSAGALSAVLTNDVVCLAMTPLLIEGCVRRRLDPLPYLLGLACAANVGSAATLIGNPQNILIGQALKLSFGQFLLDAGVPALLGLGITWAIITLQYRKRWVRELPLPEVEAAPFSRWQSLKGLGITLALVCVFLFMQHVPRDGAALVAAGALLVSHRMASRQMLALVDWQLLILFAGLFVVNDGFQRTHVMEQALEWLSARGADGARPAALFGLSALLSNLVSNVPAVMLLLPSVKHPLGGVILALASTLAGNLILVGSIANLIVVTQARSLGVHISFRAHLRTGAPVALMTLAVAALWLLLRAG